MMRMTANRLLALTAATGALACAGPALAHPGASPDHDWSDTERAVVYSSEPVVQQLPAPPPPPPPPPGDAFEHETHTMVHDRSAYPHPAPFPPGHHPGIPTWAAPHAPHAMGAFAYPAPHTAAHYPAPPRFDREAWLANCRERIRGVSREERGGVIGGLLGAVAGGVIGNRAWDAERLAGTLLGAGVGGLAGLAIGSAIGAAGDRRREDECAWHLDRYMAAGHPGYGYGYPGHAYGYGHAYPAFTYVPVLVQVPQRAVVRETVTEEWVDVPAPRRTVTQTKIVRQPAARATGRNKLIKAK
jgi:hypothetical protein